MGREIRRVPPGWQHPRGPDGQYLAMYDESYEDALARFQAGKQAWENNTHEDRRRDNGTIRDLTWEEWDGPPPRPDSYRPAFDPDSATYYQVYETISEGTPVSPVLPTLDAVKLWCVNQGYSEYAAERFAENGWAPSMVSMEAPAGSLQIGSDIAAYDVMRNEDG